MEVDLGKQTGHSPLWNGARRAWPSSINPPAWHSEAACRGAGAEDAGDSPL